MVKDTGGVLVISGVRGDTRRYRALHLMEQLRLCGLPVRFMHITEPSFDQELAQPWRMVFFHRVPCLPHMVKPIEQLRKACTPLIADFDDLIYDPAVYQYINSPDFSDPIRAGLYKDTMENIRRMLVESDGVTASTTYLADQIRGTGKPVWVHRNAFNLKMLALSEAARRVDSARDNGRVVIGYASGTPTHNRDFELIRPALMQVMTRYPQVELSLLGPLDAGDDWGSLAGRISRLKLVPWQQLPALLAGFDINLAPLVTDNPFSQSKSEIKYMEAGMVGIPTVASPTDAFSYAIRSGENGFLADSDEGWISVLSQLVEDAVLRQGMGEAAYQAVIAAYHPVTRAKQLAERLEEISQAARGSAFWNDTPPSTAEIEVRARQASAEGGWVPEQYDLGPSHVQMALYTLRSQGVVTTLKQVWIYLRRLLSPIFPFRKM